MGQYFKIIFLSDNGEFIRAFIRPWTYGNGQKLMEHAYIDTNLMKIVEILLSSKGMFYKSRVVWAGDYADPEITATEEEEGMNLYSMTKDHPYKEYSTCTKELNVSTLRYIVNHTQRQYVDKTKLNKDEDENAIHPLPLLTYEGEEVYKGSDTHLCHTWARDIISMEDDIPAGYEELKCNFVEEW